MTFVVEVVRLADGTAAGRVTIPATGRTERFHGWQALLALLADDQASDPEGSDSTPNASGKGAGRE